ncbi:19018_t:CDS:2 [Racocetra fulgida]|uniref:19018_t:CDS:1 n=1 Tax=Racocetra fulgida TaxID=60492 RepID=A0A9N8Z7I4_9GLOM|nr:19018_t:CDS:2 [Racocetra fulgida]
MRITGKFESPLNAKATRFIHSMRKHYKFVDFPNLETAIHKKRVIFQCLRIIQFKCADSIQNITLLRETIKEIDFT